MLQRFAPANHFRLGLAFALTSAMCFGLSGPFARSLMNAGWSPTAAVLARMAGGALVMTVVATAVRPGWWTEAVKHRRIIVVYGLVPIAGAQLAYYNAVAHLSVGVALLLEYTAPVLVVAWLWGITRRRPSNKTLAGVGMAIAGIMLVLDVFSSAAISGVGVAWGLAAAVCAACYFMMSNISDTTSADGTALSPITLATGGLWFGAGGVGLLGVSGLMPLQFGSADVVIGGATLSPLVAVAVLAVVPTAMAYTFGIMGVALLKPGFASLLGLSEVLFAVLWAWLLIGEAMTVTQLIGGAVVLAGLALARDQQPQIIETTLAGPEGEPETRKPILKIG